MVRLGSWKLGSWGAANAAELARAASDWRDTFDAIDGPIVVVGADGRVSRLNRAALSLAAREFRQVLGRPIASLASSQPWRAMAELSGGSAGSGERASRRVRDELGREWHVSASPIPESSRAEGRVVVLAREVTELVRLEGSLQRLEGMAALGALVSGVAHEVRNPLFAISATVDVLQERAAEHESLHPLVEALRSGLDRLTALMRDLLEYGRPFELEVVETDVGQVVAAAIHALRAAAGERQAAILALVGPGIVSARVDPGRLAQVVQNLLENALQHSPPDGEVEVRGEVVPAEGRPRLVISCADRGPGFTPEDLPRVFEPFFTRRRGGTGLGLAIVKRLVEAHGGSVEARNGHDGGAVVSCSFPLNADAAAEEAKPVGEGTAR